MRIVAITAAVFASASALLLGGPAVHAVSQTDTPTVPPVYVQVQPGDSLSSIADAKGSTYLRLFYANTDVQNPDLIYPGEKLRIPSAAEQLAERPLPAAATAPAPAAPVAAAPVVQAAPAPARALPAAPAVKVQGGSVWDRLAQCESGGNWAINTGNGFYGGLQFTLSSWRGVGGSGYPHLASRDEQIARAQILQSRQGWGAWPACSSKLGLR